MADFNLSGTVEFDINPVRKSSAALSSELKVMNRSLKQQEKAFKETGLSASELKKREETLRATIERQSASLDEKKARLASVKKGIVDFNNMTAKQAKQLDAARAAVSKEEYALSGLKNELNKTTAQQTNLKNSTVKLTDEIRDLELENKKVVQALKSQGREADALKADYQGLSNINKKYSQLLERENDKLKVLRNTMGAQSREAKQQERYVDQLARKHGFLITQQTKTKASLDQMSGSMKRATNSAKELGRKMQGIGRSTMGVGRSMSAGMTLPLVAGFGAAIKTGADFEQQMARVGAIAESSKGELKAMSDQAVDLGAKTSKSAGEVAQGMEELAALGFSAKEIMKAMPSVISASEASGADMAETATIMASSLNAFGLEAKDSGHVADLLAMAANKSAADISYMGDALKYAGPPAKALNVSLEDTSAAIGIMSDAGLEGSQAGTALRASFIRLAKPTKQSQKAMDAMGISLTNSKGEFVGMPGLIKQFQDGMKGMTKEQKLANVAQIVGTESASGFLTLIDAGPDKIGKFSKSLKDSNGASKTAADRMKDNLKGSLEQLGGAFESLAIIIAKIMAPSLRSLAEYVTALVEKFNKTPDSIKIVLIVLAALAAAIGPLLIVMGALAASWGAIAAATGIALGPIALVAAGLAGLGAGFIIAYNKSATFREGVSNALDAVGRTFKVVTGTVKAFFKMMGGWSSQGDGIDILTKLGFSTKQIQAISGFADKVREVLSSMGKAISKTFSQLKVGDAFKNMFAGIADFFKKDGAQILEALGNIATGIAAVFKFIWPIISYIIKDLWNSIKGFVTGLLTVVKGVIQVLTGIFTGDFSKIGEGLKNIFMGALQAVWNGINLMLYGKIFKGIKVFGGLFKNFFINMWNGIKSIFTGGGGGFATIFYGIWSNLLKNIRTLWTGLKTFFINVWAGITTPMIASATYIRTALLSIFRVTVAVIKTVFTGLRTFFSAFWAGVKLLFSASVTVVKNVSVAIFKGLVTFVRSIFTGLRSFFSNFWIGVKILFTKYVALVRLVTTTAFRLLVAIVKTVFNGLRAFFVRFWSIVRALFVRTVTGIKNVTVSIFRILGTIVRAIFNALRKFFVSFWSITRSIFVRTVTGIKNVTVSIFRILSSVVRSVFNALRKFFSSVWSIIRSIFVRTVTSIKNTVVSIFKVFASITRNVFNALRKFFNAVWTGIKNRTVALVRAMWNSIKSIFYILRNTITSILNKLKNTIINIWNAIKNRVVNIVTATKNNVANGFKGMYNKGKEWLDKLKNFIGNSKEAFKKKAASLGKAAANGAISGLNKMIGGINKISKAITDKELIKKIPKLSTGTRGSIKKPTPAIVNDKGRGNGKGPNGHQELIVRRTGEVEAPIGKNVLVGLGKGDSVISGAKTQQLMQSGIPQYKKGKDEEDGLAAIVKSGVKAGVKTTGKKMAKGYHSTEEGIKDAKKAAKEAGTKVVNKAKDGASWLGDKIGDVWDYVKNPGKLVNKMMKGISFGGSKANATMRMAGGAFKKLKKSLVDKVKSWFEEAEGGDGDASWLLKHKQLQPFGHYVGGLMFNGGRHYGLDFGMPTGTKIRALTDGSITQAGPVSGGGGNQVTLKEPGGKWFQWYMHMSKILTKKGAKVNAGDVIGLSGNTGNSTTPHLHIQRMKGYPSNDTAVDPTKWLKSLGSGGGSKAASKWRSDIVKAGKSMGVKLSSGDIKDIIRLIDTESSGNPRVKQGIQDENSGGNEARGLLQYTPGTFAGYKAKGAGNILNGFHQLKAFFNNSNWRRDLNAWKARMARGATGWGPTGSKRGYASGTNFARSGLANVFEKGGEIINFRGGEQVIPNDVSIAALKQMMSSDIFNQTQSAVYNGIAKYADALKEKERLRAEQERRIRERNSGSSSSEVQEMKVMMAQMLEVMQDLVMSSRNNEKWNAQTANKNNSTNWDKVEQIASAKQGKRIQDMNYGMGGTFI